MSEHEFQMRINDLLTEPLRDGDIVEFARRYTLMIAGYNSRLKTLVGWGKAYLILFDLFQNERLQLMAKKTNSGRKEAKWAGFAAGYMPQEHIDAFLEIEFDGSTLLPTIFELIQDGYGISVKMKDKDASIVASMTAQYEDMENAGLTLTAFAPDAETALGLLLYKHFTFYEGVWEKQANKGSRTLG